MRLLMTTDTVGGVWTYTRELVSGLLEADEANSILLVTLGSAANTEQLAWLQSMRTAYRTRFSYETTSLPLEWQQDNANAYQGAVSLLLRLAASFKPDLLHSNQFCFGALALSCPKVVVAHSDVLSWHAALRGNGPELEASPWLDRYREFVHNGLAGADAVVAPTRAMLQDMETGFGPQRRGHVIANGRSVPVPRIEKKLQAVTAARVWDAAKGMGVLENLLCSMPIFVAGDISHPDGSYDPGRLRRRALLGRLTETQLLALFADSDVYIVTSLYEPFGLSAVEAAQCGCAIVSRDIPSQREVWGDAATYFRDGEGLCDVLRRLSMKVDAMHEAQTRAMLRVRERYLRGHMTTGYLDLYRTLLAGKEHRPAA